MISITEQQKHSTITFQEAHNHKWTCIDIYRHLSAFIDRALLTNSKILDQAVWRPRDNRRWGFAIPTQCQIFDLCQNVYSRGCKPPGYLGLAFALGVCSRQCRLNLRLALA